MVNRTLWWIPASCLHTQTCHGVYKMRFCDSQNLDVKGEAQTAVLCTEVHECPEVFAKCFVFNKHICFITPNLFQLQPAIRVSCLTDWWSLGATELHIKYREIRAGSSSLLLWTRRPPAEEPLPSSALYLSRDLLKQDSTPQTWTLKLNIIINVHIFYLW